MGEMCPECEREGKVKICGFGGVLLLKKKDSDDE